MNNTDEAKAPTKDDGWKAIDIYLFSNGQQYSPPRKYHLQAEEMTWWEATLNHLARSQYGSLHKNIELYGLNGQKVEGPLELSDGTHYVAVVPPDAFIEAGYEKYLLKASRSWEKSQTKKANGNLNSPQRSDPPQIENSTEEIKTETPELTTLKTPDENIVVESILAMTPKNNTPKPDSRQPRKSIIGVPKTYSRTDRRRSSGPHTAFVKTPSTQMKNNSITKSKETFSKKPFTKIPIKLKENNITPAAKSKMIMKYKGTPTPPPSLTVPNSKALTNDFVPVENLISDKDIIVISTDTRLYKNPDSDIKSMKLDAYREPIVDNRVSSVVRLGKLVNEEVQTILEQSTHEVNTHGTLHSYTNSKIEVVPATFVEKDNRITCDIPLDDNYIAIINKGDPINLIMNLDIQNSATHEPDQDKSNNNEVQKISSLLDKVNTRKVSLNSNKGSPVTRTKSLQSISIPNDSNKGYAKVVIVQCGCCGNTAAVPQLVTMPVYKGDDGFYILMPNPATGENGTRVLNSDNNNWDKRKLREVSESLTNITSNTNFPCVTQDVGMMMRMSDTIASQTNACQRNDTVVTKQTVSVNEDHGNKMSRATSCSQTIVKTEPVAPAANQIKDTKDVATQTEWCSILLEAIRHDDGRYSFHLPPLQVLRCFKLT